MQRPSLYGVLFAFVLQILAWSVMPVSATGLASEDGWVVICTPDGFKRISLAEAGISPERSSNDTQSPPVLVDHCDLCVFAHSLGMGPAPVFVLEGSNSMLVVLAHKHDRLIPDNSRTPQQPRAPPVSSLI